MRPYDYDLLFDNGAIVVTRMRMACGWLYAKYILGDAPGDEQVSQVFVPWAEWHEEDEDVRD